VKPGSEVSSDEVISILSRYKNLMSLVEAGFVSIKKEKYVDVSTSMTTLRSVDSPHNTVVSECNLIDSLSSITAVCRKVETQSGKLK